MWWRPDLDTCNAFLVYQLGAVRTFWERERERTEGRGSGVSESNHFSRYQTGSWIEALSWGKQWRIHNDTMDIVSFICNMISSKSRAIYVWFLPPHWKRGMAAAAQFNTGQVLEERPIRFCCDKPAWWRHVTGSEIQLILSEPIVQARRPENYSEIR